MKAMRITNPVVSTMLRASPIATPNGGGTKIILYHAQKPKIMQPSARILPDTVKFYIYGIQYYADQYFILCRN